MALIVREEQYENYGKVLYIANEKQEMRVTLDIGPRVISYNLIGYKNMFCTDLVRKSVMNDETIPFSQQTRLPARKNQPFTSAPNW